MAPAVISRDSPSPAAAPIRGGFDQTLPLTREEKNQYVVAPVSLPVGRWYIDVGTAEWRVTDVLVVQ